MPHILFITSTNLASNPRCKKEICLALGLGYKVTYIAFSFQSWLEEKERLIQKELDNVEKIYIPAGRQKFIKWIISASCEFILRRISKFIKVKSIVSFAISRRSLQLIWRLKKINIKPDLIIAHNPAAFYPAYYLSKAKKIPFAIDIEDYHPGEGHNEVLKKLNVQLIRMILPFAIYVSYAAPLIKAQIDIDVLPKKIKNSIVINNVFSINEFVRPLDSSTLFKKLKLVWFSQNIDFGRGLEEVLPVIGELDEYFDLTLIGNLRSGFYKKYVEGKSYISIIPPLSQSELNKKLGEFDIGLAIESLGSDENRNICLTNKIWSYFQAGLFIIASNTVSQNMFLKQFNDHGIIVNLADKERLKKYFSNVYSRWSDLSSQKQTRFEVAKSSSWENEAESLKIQWKEIALI